MWLISGWDLLTFLKNKSNDVIPPIITNKFRYKSPFFLKFDNQVRICMAKLPQDFTLSGLKKGHSSVTVITGSGFDVEAGIPTFREKGFYEDKEAAYLASVDAFNSDPIRRDGTSSDL